MIIPKRVCPRFSELTADEIQDLFLSSHKIQPILERQYGCCATNLAIQDGKEGAVVYSKILKKYSHFLSKHKYESQFLPCLIQSSNPPIIAGQSVPHVHVHILPRKGGDFKRNDDIYEELEQQQLQEVFNPDAERKARTLDEMTAESNLLRGLFPDNQPSI